MKKVKLTQQERKDLNQLIQAELIKTPNADINKLALKFGVNTMTIGANKTTLKRKGLLNAEVIKKEFNTQVSALDKMTTNYQLAVKNNENTYTNHNGENKEVARVKMENWVVDSGVVGEVPTLPNTDWIIEQKIAKQLPDMQFIGAEMHEDTFVTMKQNLKKLTLNAKTYLGKIGDLIFGKVENTYAHLILDYCGMLSTFSKEIEYVINNDVIQVGGIMAITFGKPLRGTDTQSMKIKGLAPINNEDTRCISDRGIENYFAKITGWNYEVKEIFYYSDDKGKGKGYPMTLVIIKRIK